MHRAKMQVMRSGKRATYVFNGPADLGDLNNLNLNGAHIHFNGEFNLQDLQNVNLNNTTLIINDCKGVPPCTNCGSRVVSDAVPYPSPLQNPTPMPTRPLPLHRRPSNAHFQNKRRRTSSVSEHGQVESSTPLPTTATKPATHDIHPARMAMLKMADTGPDMTQPIPNLVKSPTQANRTSLPFNRLLQGKPSGQESSGTSTLRLTTGMHNSSSGSNACFNPSCESGKKDSVAAEDEAPIDVNRFLRALEPKIETLPQLSEWYGRLRSRPYLRGRNPEPVGAEGPQLSMDMMQDVEEGFIEACGDKDTVQLEDDPGVHIKDEMMG